eukprot:5109192-Pyramimonas_sp.AAC.1
MMRFCQVFSAWVGARERFGHAGCILSVAKRVGVKIVVGVVVGVVIIGPEVYTKGCHMWQARHKAK